MTYGQKLREARLAAGFTQKQAALARGVSKRTWEYWENDKNLPPSEEQKLTQESLLSWVRNQLPELGAETKPSKPTPSSPA